MIVDSSALVAILRREPDRDRFVGALGGNDVLALSAATYLETGIVVDRDGSVALSRQLDALVLGSGMEVVSVDHDQARVARVAYRDFGRGSGHPARLNFGDCFSYALAVVRDEPLLYKGDDFTHTDVRSALDG